MSIPHLANLLVERSQNANWVVVYKALITAHHLLAYGNEVRGLNGDVEEHTFVILIVISFLLSAVHPILSVE